jgi:hypothetical protein
MPSKEDPPNGGNADPSKGGANPPYVTIALAVITALSTVVSGYFANSAYSHKTEAAASAEVANQAESVAEGAKKAIRDPMPLGTVIASVLDPTHFYKVANGSGDFDPEQSRWVLADGSTSINQSALWKITNAALPPDLRGRFLRGIDTSGQRQDPDGERKEGDVQQDAFQGHTFNATNLAVGPPKSGNEFAGSPQPEPEHVLNPAGSPIALLNYGAPRIATETRPVNVAVYFYMRIN